MKAAGSSPASRERDAAMKEPDGDGCVGQEAGSSDAAGAPEADDPWMRLPPAEETNRFMALLKSFPEDEPVPLQPFLQFSRLRRVLGFESEESPAGSIPPTTAATISILHLLFAWQLSITQTRRVDAASPGVRDLGAEPAGSIDEREQTP